MPLRRRGALGLVLALAAGLAVALPAPSASAFQHDGVLIKAGKKQSWTYPGISGSAPTVPNGNTDPTTYKLRDPDSCANAAYCDTIPITFSVPKNVGTSNDVRIVFDVTWPADASDIDIFFWDNKQRKIEPAPDESAYTLFAESASGDPGERLIFVNPELDRYNLTVVAWQGPNTGYTLTTQMFVDEFTPPFELLAPPPSAIGPDGTADVPVDLSDPANVPTSTTMKKRSGPTLPPASVGDPGGFTSFDNPGFEARSGLGDLALEPAANKAAPPSALAVLLSLVVAPLAFLGTAGWWVVRRRRSVLI